MKGNIEMTMLKAVPFGTDLFNWVNSEPPPFQRIPLISSKETVSGCF